MKVANGNRDKASEFKRVLGNLLKAWPAFSCNHLRQKSLKRVGANSVGKPRGSWCAGPRVRQPRKRIGVSYERRFACEYQI